MTEYWFRYEDGLEAAYLDDTDRPQRGAVKVYVRKLKVLRYTPKGVWLYGIQYSRENPRFVLRGAKKRYACPTEQEAKESFVARKARQAGIYQKRAEDADTAIALARFGHVSVGKDW